MSDSDSQPKAITQEKAALRQVMRFRRQSVTDPTDRSRAIRDHLRSWPSYRSARSIGLYVGFRSEVPTIDWIDQFRDEGKCVATPVCSKFGLKFFRTDGPSELAAGYRGLPELAIERRVPDRSIAADQLDLVLVPGLAFDRLGGRLGQGGGFYDRTFASVPRTPMGPVLIGIGFAVQLLERIPLELHDLRMDRILTEEGWIDPER